MSDPIIHRPVAAIARAGALLILALAQQAMAEEETGPPINPEKEAVEQPAGPGFVTIDGALAPGQCIALSVPAGQERGAQDLLCRTDDGVILTGADRAEPADVPGQVEAPPPGAPGILTEVTIIGTEPGSEPRGTVDRTQVIVIERANRIRGDVLQIIRGAGGNGD